MRRDSLLTLLAIPITVSAWQWPSALVPAIPPLLLPEVFSQVLFNSSSSSPSSDNDDDAAFQLQRRQYSNTCPQDFNACTNLGAPGLCCAPQAVCSADAIGQVACCPSGYACSGTIAGIITAGTVNQQGSFLGGAAATGGGGVVTSGLQLASSTTGFVQASQTAEATTTGTNGLVQTGGGQFILDGTSVVASPGAAVRGAEIPWIARGVIQLLEMIPL